MMNKTLKVCLSRDFPLILDRQKNDIYFIYDKLSVFIGQNQYYDPYAIVDDIPENPVSGILYLILQDGTVRSYSNYEMNIIATVENTEQLNLLKQSGATFFINSDKRHLDLQRKLVTLPYLNGTYELTVDLAKNVVIDHDTVIRFDPKSNMFLMDNNKISDTYFHSGGYRGKETSTVNTVISDMRIAPEVKISKSEGNILKVNEDGLYVNAEDRVRKEQFDDWAKRYSDYKVYMERYLADLDTQIGDIADIVSVDAIIRRIDNALREAYPEIEDILARYNDLADQIQKMRSDLFSYSSDRYNIAYEDLTEQVTQASQDIWDTFEHELEELEGSGYNIGS